MSLSRTRKGENGEDGFCRKRYKPRCAACAIKEVQATIERQCPETCRKPVKPPYSTLADDQDALRRGQPPRVTVRSEQRFAIFEHLAFEGVARQQFAFHEENRVRLTQARVHYAGRANPVEREPHHGSVAPVPFTPDSLIRKHAQPKSVIVNRDIIDMPHVA